MKTAARTALILALAVTTTQVLAEEAANTRAVTVHADKSGPMINRDIFGQFAEHLGEGIYGGIWVGNDSKIPNVRGIRKDVVKALRAIKVPVVRWPGGCFADQYNWRTGVGSAEERVTTLNSTWGGVTEPNTFGTHEFMDFVEQIGSDAFISVNVGTGTPREAAQWLEYMTTDQPTTLGKERVANGRKAPYRVKYLGIGNESWGCGGPYNAKEYVERLKVYSNFVHNLNPEQRAAMPDFAAALEKGGLEALSADFFKPGENAMRRIAVGPDKADTRYTETVMQAWSKRTPQYWSIEGLSLHSYTWGIAPFTTSATNFGEEQYVSLVKETLGMEDLIAKHSAIMDKYDPEKRVALAVDEWGVWLKPMPGTELMFLKQQNSVRDAIIAALNLNIFARHADRVRMSNIAQMVNVLQAMILTDDDKMVLTPTYHIYKMYVPFQDATFIPTSFEAGEYKLNDISLPRIDALAARAADGKVWLALTNIDPNNSADITVNVEGRAAKSAVGEVLTASKVDAVNTFEKPNTVVTNPFRAGAENGKLLLSLPPKSVTVVQLED